MADELLLGPIVEITISKMISVAEEQINLLVGYEKGLKSFCRTLKLFRGFLLDASEILPGDPSVSVWLKELRKIADEADAVLDDTAYENLQHKLARKQILKQVRYFFTPSNPLAVRRRMASKINNLNAALAKLMYQVKDFGLQHTLATTRGPEPRGLIQETDASLGDSPKVFGRDGDVKEIVRLLVESGNDQPLAVVSIVGFGGLGKTTLAKLVCNNEDVKGNFFKMMWVCVSEDFDVSRILVEMFEALSHNSIGYITNQDVVVNKIKEELKGKNFLLVLDDVWNEERQKWEKLRNCLMGITQDVDRSRVLVTTRSSKVASIMGSHPARIDQLSDGDCWSIIKERAFGKSPVPLELEEIGRKIAMECRGVPLVANVVGGTLCGEKRKDKCLDIRQTISLKNCQKLSSIGKDLSSSTCLESLSIFCCQALTSIPSLDGVTSLQKLCIMHCGLSEFPVKLSSLRHLSCLEFGGFSENLEKFPDLGLISDTNGSLEDLTLVGWEKLKLLPNQIQCLTGLTSLTIEAFEGLETLPDWLGELSSLQTLRLSGCNSLRRMPSIGAMQKLSKLNELEIISCPKLEVVNEADKIFLIRRIVIDGELI